jgi:hypothetical protein
MSNVVAPLLWNRSNSNTQKTNPHKHQEDFSDLSEVTTVKYVRDNSQSAEIVQMSSLQSVNWVGVLILLVFSVIFYIGLKTGIFSINKKHIKELRDRVIPLTNNSNSREIQTFLVNESGKEVLIHSRNVLYVQAAGNYIEIQELTCKHLVRCKIGEFTCMVPDKPSYLRIHRSYVVRIDKIKGLKPRSIIVGDFEIPVSKTYRPEVAKLKLG